MKERMESIERVPQNLLNEPMTTIEAMAAVEGPRWLAQQEGMDEEAVSPAEYAISLANALEQLQKNKPATIGGKGGKNRWFVESDGSISFSETYAESSDHVTKARELGFEIVP